MTYRRIADATDIDIDARTAIIDAFDRGEIDIDTCDDIIFEIIIEDRDI